MSIARLSPTRVRCDRPKGILVSLNALADMNFRDYLIDYSRRQFVSEGALQAVLGGFLLASSFRAFDASPVETHDR